MKKTEQSTRSTKVYLLKNNGIAFYVGVSYNPEKRFRAHMCNNKAESHLIKSKIIQENRENISYEIIFKGSRDEAYNKEMEYIAKFNPIGNMTKGGKEMPNISQFPDAIEKIRQSAIGRVISEETKKKMSLSRKGKSSHLEKYVGSGEKNNRAFAVDQLDMDGNFIKTWACSKYAVDELKINKTSISECINGKQKSAGGFKWRKHENE